ncbi:MAG: HPr(Ser) kinase/phosphatase [Longimicrobiales bacterium]
MSEATAPTVTVGDLLRIKSQYLQLELLTKAADLERPIASATVSSPGLALTGFSERFPRGRLQVLGETEVRYLRSVDEDTRRQAVERLLRLAIPAMIVTKNQQVPGVLIELADAARVPVMRSKLKTGEFYRRLQPWLDDAFAPRTSMHGSMADVYGVGLLFVGRSGIGKSECVLDLVERGHRLVADDIVQVTKHGNDILIGRGADFHDHHMEIRGIGLIDIRRLFGIRAIRQQKRIEVVVNLVEWDRKDSYERTGLDGRTMEILGVSVPTVTVPLNAGKNITVITEVVAMNLLLRYSGHDTAAEFNARLIERMRRGTRRGDEAMTSVREYLEQDYE